MLCDHCHKNEATIHMTNIVNNQKTEQHLCGTCATQLQQEGKLSPYSSFMNDMWDNSFFTNDFFKNMVFKGVLNMKELYLVVELMCLKLNMK